MYLIKCTVHNTCYNSLDIAVISCSEFMDHSRSLATTIFTLLDVRFRLIIEVWL